MRPRLFLRTTEFLWQEGHTAHASESEAEEETLRILHEVYADFAEKVMALPVLRGVKTDNEKFAGALRTYCIEAMMQDGRALQAGTSHNLGQSFAQAFDIKYQTADNREDYVWTTSWGVSTRLIGALIMAHSDDEGLVCPPKLAPIQVVVVPIYKGDAERSAVLEAIERIVAGWEGRFRVKVDDRDQLTPGYKFNEWESKGVPVRVEVGPRDLEKGTVALARRDVPGKEGKQFVPQAGLVATISELLDDIQQSLFDRALRFQEERTRDVATYDELKEAIETGFARAFWAGTSEDEDRVQQEVRATIRVIPFDQPETTGRCVLTGRKSRRVVLFGRAY
jgi:prolyl-tRNA synthetase